MHPGGSVLSDKKSSSGSSALSNKKVSASFRPSAHPSDRFLARRTMTDSCTRRDGSKNESNTTRSPDPRDYHVVTISAKTQDSLTAKLTSLAAYVEANPDQDLANLAYTTTAKRTHSKLRLAFSANSVAESLIKMREKIKSRPTTVSRTRVIFAFSGQASFPRNHLVRWLIDFAGLQLSVDGSRAFRQLKVLSSRDKLVRGGGKQARPFNLGSLQPATPCIRIFLCTTRPPYLVGAGDRSVPLLAEL